LLILDKRQNKIRELFTDPQFSIDNFNKILGYKLDDNNTGFNRYSYQKQVASELVTINKIDA